MVFLLALGLLFSGPAFAQTAEAYRQHAIELSRNKSWDQAVDSYRKALALEPNDPVTHYNLALALKNKGDAGLAAEEFEATLRLKPKWPTHTPGWARPGTICTIRPPRSKNCAQAVELDPANARRMAFGAS